MVWELKEAWFALRFTRVSRLQMQWRRSEWKRTTRSCACFSVLSNLKHLLPTESRDVVVDISCIRFWPDGKRTGASSAHSPHLSHLLSGYVHR